MNLKKTRHSDKLLTLPPSELPNPVMQLILFVLFVDFVVN